MDQLINQVSKHKTVERFLGQPGALPDFVRERAKSVTGGEEPLVYALFDLNEKLGLEPRWLLLSRGFLVEIGRETRVWKIAEIQRVKEIQGLSCAELVIYGTDDEVLGRFPFSQRQRGAMSNLLFVLDQLVTGKEISLGQSADALYQDALLAPIETAQAAVNASELGAVGRLLGYLKPYQRQWCLGMLGAVGMTAFSLVPAWITGRIIDQVIRPFESGVITSNAAMEKAGTLLLMLAFAYLGKELCMALRSICMATLGENVARDLRREIFAHLQSLSVSYFSKKSTGSLITRASSDTDRIWDFIAVGVVDTVMAVLMLAGLSLALMSLDLRLGLLMTLPVPFLLYAIWANSKSREKLFLRAWRKWAGVTSVLSDVIPGIRVVKAFHQEASERKRFDERNEAVTGDFNLVHKTWAAFWAPLMLAIQAVIVAVWYFGLPRVLGAHSPSLSSGTFVAFVLYMTMFSQPIETVGQVSRMLARASSSAQRIFEVLDARPQVVEAIEPIRLDPIQGKVTFDQVVFSYDGIRRAVDGVSFEASPGEMIGLVGPSGGGKSTIVNLIARFYEPTSGAIQIDGVDLRRLEMGHYRKQVGMVLQDPYLFHGTILDNLRYGCPEAELEEVIESAIAAHAHAFITKLPHGYDTVVGERGHTLSGGERQRISIARAIMHNPRILILDEATSAVDTETERKIQEALDRLVTGRTVFAIAHRLSTLEKANRLFVVRNGRIVESGTHSELIAQTKGTYRKLCEMQTSLL